MNLLLLLLATGHTHTHTHTRRQCQCFTSPQTAGYETLIRKVAVAAPRAAMLAFASFMWCVRARAHVRVCVPGLARWEACLRVLRRQHGTAPGRRLCLAICLEGRQPLTRACGAVSVLTDCRLDKHNKPGVYFETGEDQHSVVARRYGE
jgi:hypothetical protein